MTQLLFILLLAAPLQADHPSARLPEGFDLSVVRALPVEHRGRWVPLDTLARDTIRSITGTQHFQGHDPVLLLLAFTFEPAAWMDVPVFKIGNASLRTELELDSGRTLFSYSDLVNHDRFRELFREMMHQRGGELDPLQAKVSDLTEKLMLLEGAFTGEAIHLIPNPNDALAAWSPVALPRPGSPPPDEPVAEAWTHLRTAFKARDAEAFSAVAKRLAVALAALPAKYRPGSDRIEIELHYNRLSPFRLAWQVMIGGAVLATLALFVRARWFDVLAVLGMLAGFVVLSYGLYLRWQLAGRIPASNMYESLLFLSWGMGAFAIVALLFMRLRIVPVTASIMGAVALLIADLVPGLDPFIRPAVPVLLDTIWMSIHVPIIMVSYSVLALAMLFAHAQLGLLALCPRRVSARLGPLVDALHYWYVHVGSILLLAGIITGSMWGASSWGRYWGWDPKEVWSLIAFVGYLAILHVRVDHEPRGWLGYLLAAGLTGAVFTLIVRHLWPLSEAEIIGLSGALVALVFCVSVRGPFAMAMKSVMAFWLIVMTYLGVNYVLGVGLHSYGFGKGEMAWWMFLIGGIDLALIVVLGLIYLARTLPAAPASRPASA